MKTLSILLVCFIAIFALMTSVDALEAEKQCVPFSSITSIHFEPGMTTSRRRTPNQPRMSCVGSCPMEAIVTNAQCKQTGISDNGLPSWKCVGSFANTPGDNHQYRLGNVKVACEGCNKQGDSDVVVGSCTLKYSVESRMRRRANTPGIHTSSWESHHNHASLSLGDFLIISFVVFGTCYCCIAMNRERRRRYETNDNKTLHEMEKNGSPTTSGNGVHHHHYDGGYGGGWGGGGFFNGMMLGSLMSGGWGGHYGSHTTIVNNSYGGGDDYGYGGGSSDWGSGGGFGDSLSD